jgi:hypothetical protein
MHVLPLPFGLALAVLPRRDADKIRTEKPAPELRDGLLSVTALRDRVYVQMPHRVA